MKSLFLMVKLLTWRNLENLLQLQHGTSWVVTGVASLLLPSTAWPRNASPFWWPSFGRRVAGPGCRGWPVTWLMVRKPQILDMAMDRYLLIPFLMGWTSINPSYFEVHQGYKVLTHCHINEYQMSCLVWHGIIISYSISWHSESINAFKLFLSFLGYPRINNESSTDGVTL